MSADDGAAGYVDDVDDGLDFIANGIDARSGRYLVPPLSPHVMSEIALGRALDSETTAILAAAAREGEKTLGTIHGVDANRLDEAGWGVVFAADDPDTDAMREALSPLLTLREEQCGRLYHEFSGSEGIPANADGWDFLASLGSATGQPVDPSIVPYYLTIVAPPHVVSFDAQCAIDSQNAVGRLWFDGDTLQERLDKLAKYATDVVARERRAAQVPLRALFFATRNKGDKATQRSARFLASPVSQAFEQKHSAWAVDSHIGATATKDVLVAALTGSTPPGLLVTATHGAAFHLDDAQQRERQGALVCQDWEGLASVAPVAEGEYVAAYDIAAAQLPGTIAFLFACYGAGTPANDAFLPPEVLTDTRIATEAFVARLPQQLLLSGAAAVIGHVERAWTCSFQWPGAGAQTQVFKSLFDALAAGERVGAAMEFFDSRSGSVSRQLVEATRARAVKQNEMEVGALWTAQMDARNYIVLGDPATRLDV